jgi:hypothetical protein
VDIVGIALVVCPITERRNAGESRTKARGTTTSDLIFGP